MKITNETIGFAPAPRLLLCLDERRDAVETPDQVGYTAQEVTEIINKCVRKQGGEMSKREIPLPRTTMFSQCHNVEAETSYEFFNLYS